MNFLKIPRLTQALITMDALYLIQLFLTKYGLTKFVNYVMMFGLVVFWNHIFFLDIPHWLHLILNWFACITVMGVIHYITLRAYEPIAKAMMHRELMKLQEDDEPE